MNPKLRGDVIFDSHFESGNLDTVVQVSSDEYDLFMRVDSNTKGHFTWYYFKMQSPIKKRIRLNICTFIKVMIRSL
jgi:hypothetical protein